MRSYGWLSPAAKCRFEQVSTLLDAPVAVQPLQFAAPGVCVACPHCQKPMRRIAQTERDPPFLIAAFP